MQKAKEIMESRLYEILERMREVQDDPIKLREYTLVIESLVLSLERVGACIAMTEGK